MLVKCDRFRARGASGKIYTIVANHKSLTCRSSNRALQTKMIVEYILSDGDYVSEKDDGTFLIAQTREVLIRL